jgi:hypothetical protein
MSKTLETYKDLGLRASVTKTGKVVIELGINTLADAAANMPDNNYGDDCNDWFLQFKIIDAAEFAKDVVIEMMREEEDGSTPLIYFIDKVCRLAIDNGSCGCQENTED